MSALATLGIIIAILIVVACGLFVWCAASVSGEGEG